VLYERPTCIPVSADHVEHALRQELRGDLGPSMTLVTGVVSLGFRTTVLPAAIAGANFQTAIIIG